MIDSKQLENLKFELQLLQLAQNFYSKAYRDAVSQDDREYYKDKDIKTIADIKSLVTTIKKLEG